MALTDKARADSWEIVPFSSKKFLRTSFDVSATTCSLTRLFTVLSRLECRFCSASGHGRTMCEQNKKLVIASSEKDDLHGLIVE